MDGVQGACAAVAGWLAERLPARLEAVAVRAGTSDPLPAPGRVCTEESGPVPLEDWPVVHVLPQATESLLFVDALADGTEIYQVRYALRVLAWVRAPDYAAVAAMRTRYALAIRETLLERKAITAPTAPRAGQLAIDPTRWRESYSELLDDDSAATIAGVYLDLVVTATEHLDTGPVRGYAGRIDVTVTDRVTDPRGDTAPLPHPGM